MKPYAPMTLDDARRHLQVEILWVALPGLSAYYALMTVAHSLMLEGPIRWVMVPLAGATTLALGALVPFRNQEIVRAHAHAVAAFTGLLIVANSLLHLWLTGDAYQTTNLVLVAIGAAALLTSTPSFIATLALNRAGWLVAVLAHPGEPLWHHFGFALLGAEMLAIVVFVVRSRGTRAQFEAEQERDHNEVGRRAAAATALAHESRYRAVVALSPAAILVHREGTIQFANRSAAQLIGVHKESAIVGSPLFDLFSPAEREHVVAWSEAALAEVDDGAPMECRLRAVEGPWPYVELSTKAITWEGEAAAVLVATDVTARRETVRLKDELVAIVGHELRRPVTEALDALNAIQSNDEAADPTIPEQVAQAVRHLGHLRVLLDDLLDLEMAHSGQLQLTHAPLNLVALLREAVAEVAPSAEQAGVWLEAPPGPDTLGVLGDRARLAQVLTNLLTNAVRASKAGQVVRARVTVAGDFARVEVEDEGQGISPAMRARVFERFGRDPAESGPQTRGLGLAICKALVEAHGGQIGFDSDEAPGTSFWFTVPRVALPAGTSA